MYDQFEPCALIPSPHKYDTRDTLQRRASCYESGIEQGFLFPSTSLGDSSIHSNIFVTFPSESDNEPTTEAEASMESQRESSQGREMGHECTAILEMTSSDAQSSKL